MGKGERNAVRPRPDAEGLEKIRARAEEDLVLVDAQGKSDQCLWEQARRTGETVIWIAGLPELAGQTIDLAAALSAALYSDAGWAVQVRQGHASRLDVLSRATNDLQRDLAIDLLEKRLRDLLAPASLRRAAECIREMKNQQADFIERHIVADACILGEIGLVPLLLLCRRDAVEGKPLSSVIKAWQTRKQFRYWECFIDPIRYDRVRQVAVARLRSYDEFLEALAGEINGNDLKPTELGNATAPIPTPPNR